MLDEMVLQISEVSLIYGELLRVFPFDRLCCPLCRSSLDSLIPENVRSKVADTVEEEVVLLKLGEHIYVHGSFVLSGY